MGTRVDDLTEELQISGNYTCSYYIHGLSGEQGKRYSWVYPACSDLKEHDKLFSILPTDQICVSLTKAFQLIPKQSTAAIVVHHLEAKYFSIGSGAERAKEDISSIVTA